MAHKVQDFCTARQDRILHRQQKRRDAGFLPMTPAQHRQHVAENLTQIVGAIGGPRVRIAERIGATKEKFGNWLRGDNYPDPYAMWRLCEAYGVTMDWIFRGRTYGLPVELAASLQAAAEASREASPARARRGTGK
jgi:transcriptional regulator with XRE-family HTH domain